MLRLLKEPLLHFVLLGGAAFAAYELSREPETVASRDEIVVTAAQVRQAEEVFAKTWQRPPTPDERAKLIESRVREEVYYREALAAGLEKDDVIVRRRMKQKLEFMLEDIAGQAAPTQQELRAFFEANGDRFRSEARSSFRHVYFSGDKRKNAPEDARKLLPQLQQEGALADTSTRGDRLLMVEPAFSTAPSREIARAFGREFADQLAQAPIGKWWGPIRSGFGVHLVFVESRIDGELPDLDAVRDVVTREWSVVKRREMNEALYLELRGKYAITVESE